MVFPIFSSQQEQEKTNFQNPIFTNLDELYCQEEPLIEEGYAFDSFENEEKFEKCDENLKKTSTFFEHDLFWEDDEVVRLLCKEKETHSCYNELSSDGLLMVDRKESVEWILKVVAHYGFTALTGVLAVKYYDGFVSSLYFQKDKPWMSQLAAVACLSIAAKMEEIQVPLLLDLQVENSKFVFEAKTIMRMELLVLSNLKWKTSFVTPISFFDHIVRRFGLMMNLHCGFLKRCEQILLSTIVDSRLMHYLPSVIATATMLFVIDEMDPCNTMDYRNQLLTVLSICKEKVDECYQLIIELMDNHGLEGSKTHKRKHSSIPGSPSGVIDAYINSDSSNDSWSVASSVSSSPLLLFKKSRSQDQPMRLASLGSVSVSVCRKMH